MFCCGKILAETPRLAPPQAEGVWLRPSQEFPADPVYGFVNGIRIGLPYGEPPGILRVFHPAITGGPDIPINYIAVEPIVNGVRGYSELEPSKLNKKQGKRMWAADVPNPPVKETLHPSRGIVTTSGSREQLSVYVGVEPFLNGAKAYLRLTFDSWCTDEVQIETFATTTSAKMSHCIITATMGNYERLRQLWLKDRVVTSHELWPDFPGRGFAPHKSFDLSQLYRTRREDVLVCTTPDEANPASVDTGNFWRYYGLLATQYWRVEAENVDSAIVAKVNARATYYGSRNKIPGGISYENFEMQAPFGDGQRFTFGVTTKTVEQLRDGSRHLPAIFESKAQECAESGTEFCSRTFELPLAEREDAILSQALAGNIPDFLRCLSPVACTVTSRTAGRSGTIFVTPDYFAVGADHDFVRMPMTPGTAHRIAEAYECILPTRKMVNDIYQSSRVRLAPQPIPPTPEMTSMSTFCRHHSMIEEQRQITGAANGLLTSGHKKDIVVTPLLSQRPPPARVAIYGWHRTDGSAIQPLSLVHNSRYADYSHGIRLVSRTMMLDGETTEVASVLADPLLCELISDEGPVTQGYGTE